MRRRPVEFRRPVRRRISSVVWWTLCGISVLLFIVIFSKESHIESRPASLNKVKICALLIILLFWVDVNVFGCWKYGNFEGNQCFELWDFYEFGIWRYNSFNWVLVGTVNGLDEDWDIQFWDCSCIMTWLLSQIAVSACMCFCAVGFVFMCRMEFLFDPWLCLS